jgi:hypothetical protein
MTALKSTAVPHSGQFTLMFRKMDMAHLFKGWQRADGAAERCGRTVPRIMTFAAGIGPALTTA